MSVVQVLTWQQGAARAGMLNIKMLARHRGMLGEAHVLEIQDFSHIFFFESILRRHSDDEHSKELEEPLHTIFLYNVVPHCFVD
eukprot:scaffold5885_cov24-Tisochrysis_lutea.AAC.1